MKQPFKNTTMLQVALHGIEPRFADPKSAVLPLYERAMVGRGLIDSTLSSTPRTRTVSHAVATFHQVAKRVHPRRIHKTVEFIN
jgi:hypothetical protein